MSSIYIINNSENKTYIEYNDMLLLETIKVLLQRKKPLALKYIDIWEELEGKKFSEKYLL